MVFSPVHPLVESDPAERTPAREETSPAEAVAWLEDPQPPPPPESIQQYMVRQLAEAIGWRPERMQEAITELMEYDPEKRRKARGVPADPVGGV